ncbi:thiolase family protein [Halorarum halophilum]|uniref:Thiolase family protein n=1 Tax=Halorarum halophilum TaxID=2743090 RepID=A0A7D5KN83_9EURY|nr:thiolase family protein [Halobaculum halophilum]QLG28322.1 thiolase family protein [Halobaculum halophilum]
MAVSDAAPTVAGVGMTPFESETDDRLLDLVERAALAALADADVTPTELDAVVVGNMAAEAFTDRSGLANALVDSVGATGASADRVENTSASGASAFKRGVEAVTAGHAERVLVVGGEHMSAVDRERSTEIVGSIVHGTERRHGVTLPSLAGVATDAYLREHDADRAALSEVAVKNHGNAAANPYAQFRTPVTREEVESSPAVADPLRLYDCCPTSDGAAAVVLAPEGDVRVTGVAGATGTHAVPERQSVLRVESVAKAGTRALSAAGISPADVDVACVHDAFTVLELLELEELGFYGPGAAWKAVLDGETAVDGTLPVNPGGGLKARGHPLGATGVAQLVELVWQLRGEAVGRQATPAYTGLAVNVAGFGNNSICTILEADT